VTRVVSVAVYDLKINKKKIWTFKTINAEATT